MAEMLRMVWLSEAVAVLTRSIEMWKHQKLESAKPVRGTDYLLVSCPGRALERRPLRSPRRSGPARARRRRDAHRFPLARRACSPRGGYCDTLPGWYDRRGHLLRRGQAVGGKCTGMLGAGCLAQGDTTNQEAITVAGDTLQQQVSPKGSLEN